ncbi:PD-(D/E)XK nuclease family protein [Shewanella alkalitolerans]|uniref:PD-(D/E)XK nuclease family protein n=1 Tax=Shewanella alkalitolerans TaxID=2864209 RepID=UPI001C65A5CE|nr:PD-(D/E)XK nuclease family protein [Shewanella alkalitolerans]QYJ99357.1 PD-(D/E)XK nuclease family protein [Shewanella alkalitolerans]
MESLLVNVSKYAASHQTSPIENFITEAFSWILKYDVTVRTAFSTLLKKKAEQNNVIFKSLSGSNDIETQVNFSGKFPDLVWTAEDNDFCAIFEHKIWSELHSNQLNNYRDYARQYLNNAYVIVLITAHVGQHRQSPDIALCWHEVAKIIEELEGNDERESWLRSEFNHLLKSNGLLNFTPINPLAISYYNDAKNIDAQLYKIVQRTIESPWPVYDSDINFHHSAKHRCSRGKYDCWGRIGLEFCSNSTENDEVGWKPALFCGFMIDGEDHRASDLLTDGPIATVILSVNKKLQSKLKTGGHYDRFVKDLQKELPNSWQVSDRTTKGQRANPWHPLIVYCSLSHFMKGANIFEEQDAAYFNQMVALQRLFLRISSFGDFCMEMKRQHDL